MIISILAHRTVAQRSLIRKTYSEIYGEDLLKELDKELSSDFEARFCLLISSFEICYCLNEMLLWCKSICTEQKIFSEFYSPRSVFMNCVVLHTADCTFVDIGIRGS